MITRYGYKELEKEFGSLTFASFLLAHRMGEECSQIEMAKKLEISKQSLCDLEKGRRIPSPSRAEKIAKKLGLMPESLIELAISDQLKEENLNYVIRVSKKSKAS